MTQTIGRPTVTDADAKALFAAMGPDKPNGPALAALLASGIGVTANFDDFSSSIAGTTLNGTVKDDGLPSPPPVSHHRAWSLIIWA